MMYKMYKYVIWALDDDRLFVLSKESKIEIMLSSNTEYS